MQAKSLLTVVLLVSGCASATASIVMDQIGDDRSYSADGSIAASQNFEGSLDAYDVRFLDDFMVSDDRLITKIETVTGIFNNLPGAAFSQVRGWRIEIFSSPSIASTSHVGDVVSKWVSPSSVVLDTSWSSATDLYALACIPTSIQLPNPGQYWISVIPQLDYLSSGQIGVVESAFPGQPGNNNSSKRILVVEWDFMEVYLTETPMVPTELKHF